MIKKINNLINSFKALFFQSKLKSQERIDENEKKYRAIFENMQELYYEALLDGTILEISPSVSNILGYEQYEIIGMNMIELYLHKEHRNQVVEMIKNGEQIENVEVEVKRKDGTIRTLWINISSIDDLKGKKKYIGFARDVTEYVETQRKLVKKVDELKASEDKLRKATNEIESIFESTDDLIWTVDRNYCIVGYNSSLKKHIKKSYGKNVEIGSRIEDLIVEHGVVSWKSFYDKVITSGKQHFEYHTLKGDKYIDIYLNPIYKDGEVHEISVFAKDITERKLSEYKISKLNQELEQRVKEQTAELQSAYEELESFTYTISHDLKSHFRAIDGYAQIILEDYEETFDDELTQRITNIIGICDEMINFIAKLLQYSTTSKLNIKKEEIKIKDIFISEANHLKSYYSDRKITLDFESEMPIVNADPVLIKQLVHNLLSNAFKFTKNKEVAIINVSCSEDENEQVFCIEDNGVGFDMKYAEKLFNIFQRIHDAEDYEGSGIGLATVHKIIEKHGGRVWIEGKRNIGAKVIFTLPLNIN